MGRAAGERFLATGLVDGATLAGDGTFTMPDGTVQRPGVEHLVHADLTAAGTQLSHGSSKAAGVVLKIQSTVGALTLSATPTIQPGAFDGQELELVVDKDTSGGITLQDETALAGSGLRMSAASIAINARDAIYFTWVSEESAWYLSGARVNNL